MGGGAALIGPGNAAACHQGGQKGWMDQEPSSSPSGTSATKGTGISKSDDDPCPGAAVKRELPKGVVTNLTSVEPLRTKKKFLPWVTRGHLGKAVLECAVPLRAERVGDYWLLVTVRQWHFPLILACFCPPGWQSVQLQQSSSCPSQNRDSQDRSHRLTGFGGSTALWPSRK
ncbi:uncharacterized protein BO80DRAFT_44557 [Aspergillus ibericus CBS 121593]|uniref:Uncharacterized protein n=1 Tax=Aspergillus ibericus CBS 121593 TaxID=1448316 RepID=A0A395H2E9_9EURO|nr:hypothetical protein BO80DRAFT_44557 [Aspergillus ibericus CBS 121593]RAL01843.1 hypothetical protein BO80DRAFT_44557 [Aspergillus ibericus CBS 121593]